MPTSADTPLHSADLLVIGSGPGGHEAALLGARTGLKVILVEKGPLGGVCVNWGCIPTKALLRSAEVADLVERAATFGVQAESKGFDMAAAVKRSRTVSLKASKGVEFTLKRAGVAVVRGEARLTDTNSVEVWQEGSVAARIEARDIILATGSRQRRILGLEPDGRRVVTSTEALIMKEAPSRVVVLGGGAIGVEFAWYLSRAGASVTLVEMMPRLLPLEDAEVSEVLSRSFQKAGITVETGARLTLESTTDTGVQVAITSGEAEPRSLEADCLLVAVGVEGNVEGYGLETAGVEVERGFIRTDAECRTSVPGIWAIGDVRGGMLLAHKASAEAAIAVAAITGREAAPLDEAKIPRCVYAEPSVASIGMSEEQAAAAGLQVKIGKAMFAASGKANAYGSLEGFVKLLFAASDSRLVGAHLVGHGAVELIGELSLACSLGLTPQAIAGCVHAHPTLSESVREAALGAMETEK